MLVFFRAPSERQLAGPEGPHAWGRRRVLRRRLQRRDWSCRICAQRRHDLCRSQAGQHQIPLPWGMCMIFSIMDNCSMLCCAEVSTSGNVTCREQQPALNSICGISTVGRNVCLFNVKFSCVRQGETAYIRVKLDGPRSPSYGRSRSRSRGSRSRSRSRSASRSRSNSRGRGRGSPRYSPRHSRSRSRS